MVKDRLSKTELVKQIIVRNSYMNIATVTSDGQPWNTPVFFAYSGGRFYWFSAKFSVHSQNIKHNGNVFITIYDSTAPEGEGKGLYIQANAHVVSDELLDEGIVAYNHKAQKFKIDKPFVRNSSPNSLYCAEVVKVWTNDDDEVDGDYVDIREQIVLDGHTTKGNTR